MKKETNKKSNILSKIKKQYNDLKDNPKEFLKQLLQSIKQYLHENKLFFIFVFINVLNAFLLRLFTLGSTGNVFDIRTLLADFSFVTMLGSLSYLMRRKGKFSYLFIVTIILTAICTINSAYYTFYTSFSSISLLSTAKFITAVGDAVVENVLQPKDLIYIIMPCVLLYFHNHYKKNGYYEKVNFFSRSKKRFKNTLIVGLAAVALFAKIGRAHV